MRSHGRYYYCHLYFPDEMHKGSCEHTTVSGRDGTCHWLLVSRVNILDHYLYIQRQHGAFWFSGIPLLNIVPYPDVFLMWVFFMSLAVSHLSCDNERDKRDQLPAALVGAHSRQVALAALPFLTRHSWMPAVFSELEERADGDRINSPCSSGFHIVGVLVALHQEFNILAVTMLSSGLLP